MIWALTWEFVGVVVDLEDAGVCVGEERSKRSAEVVTQTSCPSVLCTIMNIIVLNIF